MKRLGKKIGTFFVFTLLFLFAVTLYAESAEVVLWNKLGSQQEIENSEAGPDGTIVYGTLIFSPGKFGNGFTSQDGKGKSGVYLGPWENINPDYHLAGTVEFWWKPARDYDDDGQPDELFVSGLWSDPWVLPFQLMYRWRTQGGQFLGGFEFSLSGYGVNHTLRTGKVVEFSAGDWIHVAFVWDMNGLPDHSDVWYGTYINGQYVPLTDITNPGGTINYAMVPFEGAYCSMGYYQADYYNQQNGVIDNVVIWNQALSDFEHRFIECPIPSYSCVGFESPLNRGPVTVKGNSRALPCKAQLEDNGGPVTDADIDAAPVIQVMYDSGQGDAEDVTDDALPAGQGTEGNQFVYTDQSKWQFNLKTKDYTAPGTYTITMKSGNDNEYKIAPTCEAQFVRE